MEARLHSLALDSGCGSVGRAVTLTSEARGSNPVIGKLLYGTFVYCHL